ncbi:unnamed protein product [Vicia faba]|uniref:Uncharacterized protein ycf68 n=1 Tax=Vicia faba TaxID=3906 RepID=A0AAV0YBV8_VICFA|nr:unnamed protein product [Vicia faba]
MPRILLKERSAFGNADTGGAWLSSARATAGDKPEEGEDDVKSSCPLALGDTRVTMDGTKDRDPAREGDAEGTVSDWSEVVTRAISHIDSSMCSSAPDPEMRIDGAIQVRSNVDPTFYSLVGSGRSRGDHHGASPLENSYILISIWTAISRAQVEVWPQWKKKNGAPNNVSSQTKNYEIIPFILG